MATGVHEPDRGAYPLGRSRGVGTAARAASVALPARPAAGKEATHGTTETDPSGQRTHTRSPPHDGRAGKSHAGRAARGESPPLHGAHHRPGPSSLEEEHKAWGKVLRALTDMQTELDQIAQSEHQRIAQ